MRRPAAIALLAVSLTLPAVPAAAQETAAPASPGPGTPRPVVPTAVIDVWSEPGVPGELYRIELTAPGALEGAYALLRGEEAPAIPTGLIVWDDPGPNAPWSWHIDPASLEWVDMAMEICDGRPTQIQDGVLTIERFCPWSASVLAIEHDPAAPQRGWTGDTGEAFQASGGTSTEDRTFSRWVPLTGGSYTVRLRTGPNLDPTVSGCPAEVRLLTWDGGPAPGSGTPYPTVQPDDTLALTWPDLPMGAYVLWLSLDCVWSVDFGPSTTSAS